MTEYISKAHLLKLIEQGWEGLDYSYNNFYHYSKGWTSIAGCCAIGAAGLAYDKETGQEPPDFMVTRHRDPGMIRNVVPENIKTMIFKINDGVWIHNEDGFVTKSLAAKKKYILDKLEKELPEWT